MPRIKLLIEYDGTDFIGWQTQPNGRSVQAAIERALEELFGTATRIHGAGRTDTGVHASGQVAHFDAETLLSPATIVNALNARLPEDVVVKRADVADDAFHARFSASSRRYTYRIFTGRSALLRRNHWLFYARLNLQEMQEAVNFLTGTHDFTTLSKYSDDSKHGFCHVFHARLEVEGSLYRFDITANRFLTGMVRSIVGGLAQVGRGKMTAQEFDARLQARNRTHAPQLAPPHGLTLEEVKYDKDEYEFIRGILNALRMERERSVV